MRIKARTKDGQEVYIIAVHNGSAYVVDKQGRIGWCEFHNITVIDMNYLTKNEVTENE